MGIHRTRLIIVVSLLLAVTAACMCTSLPSSIPIDPGLGSFPNFVEDTPTPRPIPTTVENLTDDTVNRIAASVVPFRDRYDLAARFLGLRNVPTQVALDNLPQEGDTEQFYLEAGDTDTVTTVTAELVYAGEHVALWFEEGADIDRSAIRRSGQKFDENIYPTNRETFGSEPNPGVDGDPRIHVLNTSQLGSGLAGYFFSPSLYPSSIVPYSNEKEIIYLNLGALSPGSDYYESVLAHEFQHMIHYNVDANEESWGNEGLSEVASTLNGYGISDAASFYLSDPGTQLNTWPENEDTTPHYGAGYLFYTYFLDRFGQDAMRTLIARQENGLQAVDAELASLNAGLTADELFGDWVIANLLNDPSVSDGRYAYQWISLPFTASITETFTNYPISRDMDVHQYGAKILELHGPASLNIQFQGGAQVGVIPASTFDTDANADTLDSMVWWSNRVDDSDTTLTRAVDLTGVSQATLEFDLWYQIEEDWDYGYVEVSTDGGQSWTILELPDTTTSNPHGNSYGSGYTGHSANLSGANSEGWVHQSADLSAYAGQYILLRFEYLTDDATITPGMAIDNVCINEIGFCDSMENGEEGWDAQGFVLIDNLLPQRYLIQLVVRADDGKVTVMPLTLDEANAGQMTIDVGSSPAYLVISGLTRFTTEPAPFHIEITD